MECCSMNRKFLPLILLVLLSGSAAAQQVLFENPWDPQGTGGLALGSGFGNQSATTFTLGSDSTVQTVSIIVEDLFSRTLEYNWSVYSDVNGLPGGVPGPISGPTGLQSYVPLFSGEGTNFSALNIVPPDQFGFNAINEISIDIGPIDLSAGTYFLALSGQEGTGVDGWLPGISNTGSATAVVGGWTPAGAGGEALTVIGKVAAPEISSSSAIGALTLLLGSLMVLRGRRSTRPIAYA